MELDSECNEVRRHAGAGGFFHSEVTGSIAPLACTVLALAWANSRWADDYFHLLHTPIGVSWGDASFRLSLHDWINDGLMAVFFFVVGIEIKRELVVGELSSAAKAALPVAAAAGGMLVPAVLFTAFNFGGPGAHGWGIPMATDIAFALGVLAMFGTRVPVGLKVFLTALAIAADKRGGGGGGGARAGGGGGAKQKPQVNNSKQDKRTNNVRNTSVNNVNNNVNVNKNVNVNVDDRGGCCGWDNDYHPVATAAAVTATVAVTSAVVGSIVNAPPPGCKPVNYGGIVYQQCGSTWYQPQGTQYVVINPPY